MFSTIKRSVDYTTYCRIRIHSVIFMRSVDQVFSVSFEISVNHDLGTVLRSVNVLSSVLRSVNVLSSVLRSVNALSSQANISFKISECTV